MGIRYDHDAVFQAMIGPEPQFDHIDETLEADLIVVGGGIAGVSAVRAAAEAGAKVLLFEKCADVQARSGAFGAINFMKTDRWERNFSDRKQQIIAEIVKEGGYRGDYNIIKYWAEHSGEDFEWYIQPMPELVLLDKATDPAPEGCDYFLQPARYPLPEHYDPDDNEYFPTYMGLWQFRPGGHMRCLKRNFEVACATGLVTARFHTPVQTLVRVNGRVTGVIAQDKEGKLIRATAKHGVVLATGDYSGDEDMLYYYAPQLQGSPRIYGSRDAFGKMANTGDGHRMGVWAGAKLEDPPHAYVAHSMGGPLGITAFLQLDRFGRRFMNEDAGGMQIENRIERLPGKFSWQIFDSTWPSHAADFSIIHGTVSNLFNKQDQLDGKINRTLNKMDGYTSVEDVEKEAESGKLLKADTIEELIEKMGLPKETALASIARYNELCEKGHDEDYGKKASRMFPVSTGPFYAGRLTPAPVLVTVSGLASDADAHVLTPEGCPIPGLYCAGNVQGNRFGGEDPSMFPGTSHTIALSFGRLAAQNALKGI